MRALPLAQLNRDFWKVNRTCCLARILNHALSEVEEMVEGRALAAGVCVSDQGQAEIIPK
jgi:hypothetical protein